MKQRLALVLVLAVAVVPGVLGANSLVEGFEDGDLSEYGGDTSLYDVHQTTVFNGSYSLYQDDQYGGPTGIATDKTNFSQGTEMTYRMRYVNNTAAGGGDEIFFIYGVQSTSSPLVDSYGVSYSPTNDRFRIDKRVGGSFTTLTSESSVVAPADEWWKIKVTWDNSGGHTAVLFDAQGNVLSNISTTDSTYTTGGFGFGAFGNAEYYADDIKTNTSTANNFTIKAEDAFNGNSIQNFTANLTGQTTGTQYDLNTTTGTLTTMVLTNSSEVWDVRVDSQGYQSRTYQDINVSTNTTLTARLDDNRTEFTEATTKITQDTLTDFNVTIQEKTFQSNTTFASPDDYNATFSKAGWFNKTEAFNASLSNEFKDVYDADLTVDLDDKISGNDVDNYTASVANTTYTFEETKNTTTGSITFDVVQNESYNVTVDSDDYPRTSRSILVNQSSQTETYTLLEERTAQLTFKDTTGNSLITQQVNYTLTPTNIDSPVVSGDTSTGSANETLLEPASYRGQAEASGFEPNTFFFTIQDESINEKTVYLTGENKTSPITVTVLDQATNPVSGVKVRLQRFYTNTSTYNTITASQTDSEGQTTLFPPADRAYYKFTFNRDQDLLKITNPQQLLKSTFQFTLNLGQSKLTESNAYTALSTNLRFDNATSDFKATIDQSGENNKACLITERTGALRTTQLNKTCTTSTTATLILPRGQANDTYTATVTYQTQKSTFEVDTLTKSFGDETPATTTGLLGQLILTLVAGVPAVALLPSLSPVIIATTLALGWWIGLTTIGLPAVMAILVAGVTATIAARKR